MSVGSRELRPGLQVVSSQPAGGVEDAIGRLQDLVATVLDENDQLRRALESRIVIEQAKGVLAERYGIDVQTAFEVLRGSARSNRMSIHALAEAVVASPETPPQIQPPRSGLGSKPRARAPGRSRRSGRTPSPRRAS